MNFEIIGKFGGNYLIYKNPRNRDYICVYDNEMKQIGKVEMDYIPDDRLINVDFFPFSDFTYVIYQYQKKNVVYCMAVTVDGLGKRITEPMQLDTSHLGFAANNKIYSAISSEDKSKIVIFKINNRNKQNYLVTSLLLMINWSSRKEALSISVWMTAMITSMSFLLIMMVILCL
ncbi:MAG: hypothetical protein WDO19_25145 [Bacteroidota bacterium]